MHASKNTVWKYKIFCATPVIGVINYQKSEKHVIFEVSKKLEFEFGESLHQSFHPEKFTVIAYIEIKMIFCDS